MLKRLLSASVLAVMMLAPGITNAADYNLPANIQDGNILHCFNWPVSAVKSELPAIAAAGFGSVQLSPLQRPDVSASGSPWHDLYRPYDLAFKASSFCSEQDLKDLCAEAETYGIKVIVDVVANHVDKTAGYHDTWWDSNGRVRWNGGINYSDRYSITHGQLGDYGDVNSEDSEVQARGKAYVEFLKGCGVDGIRWDAAKHIATPSEGCNFWSTVTSVSGMWHYGEILNDDGSPINEYANYMSVTDNRYSNSAAKDNGGIQQGYGGAWAVDKGVASSKLVYWAESHDTYSNDEWSQNVDQSVIDRAYACVATRNGTAALYLSRPNTKGFDNIKTGKGSTAFKSAAITAVNKLRNAAGSAKDYCTSTGSAFSCTRDGVGAVIVMKGSGNISIANGGGYCPTGTYTDMVSGGTFTVTASTISGNVGSSGIAVIMKDGVVVPPVDPEDPEDSTASMWILGNLPGTAGWSTTPGTGFAMTQSGTKYTAKGVQFVAATGETMSYFNLTDFVGSTWDALNAGANRYGAATEGESITLGTAATIVKYTNNVNASACLSWAIAPGTYDITADLSTMKITVVNAGDSPVDPEDPEDPEDPTTLTIVGDYNLAYSGNHTYVYTWPTGGDGTPGWPGTQMGTAQGSDGKTYKVFKVPSSDKNVIFNTPNGGQTADLTYSGSYVMDDNGATSTAVIFKSGEEPVTKPVVSASPASTSFTESITVTLSVSPDATIYYTTDGNAPTTSSSKYSTPLTFTSTTTLKAFGVTADGTQGDVKTFTYTKGSTPPPIPTPGDNLITDYYKVNPNGQYGTNKTINVTGHPATNALSNWTEAELIAQGVARDVCQAFKGVHERPIVDSYALYAAYDSENLYLGVQYVYTVWDIGGEGKQGGESKPYNMDGKLCIAFDLDPNASYEGITNEGSSIWQNGVYTTFNNGADAWWYGSTKPGTGTPGYFVPNASGICDYTDPNSCKTSEVVYGYTDGLLPSITAIYGQDDFSYDPELLKGNTGFTDLRSEAEDSWHTFYEYKFPLSMMGITEDYIKNNGIGVMVVDFYGASAHASLPYDPSFFDNVFEEYSQDPSSSGEKEDKDVVTYSMARVGKGATLSTNVVNSDRDFSGNFRLGNGCIEFYGLSGESVSVSSIDGRTMFSSRATSDVTVDLPSGVYIVNIDGVGKAVRVL